MKHLSLKESAYKIIKKKMLNLEFEPGSRIREDLLAQEISMSRTPVREAINQLTAEGFVKNIPRKGIFFIQLTPEEINNLLDVREALETLSVEICIDKIDDAQLNNLYHIMEEFELALSEERYKDCNDLDSKFHLEIAKISGNWKLIEFLSEIEDFMHIAREMEKKVLPREKNEITLKEHRVILECIKNGDKEAAKEALRVNISRMRANLGI